MAFEVYVAWYQKGEEATVPLGDVEALFLASIAAREDESWRLRYGDQDCVADLQLRGEQLACLSLERPCEALELWESLHRAMRLANGVCFWPGGPAVVTDERVAGELPADMLEDGEPVVVRNAEELRTAVAEG